MYHHFNNKKRLTLRIISYTLMTLAVIIGVFFVAAWVTGWRLDIKSQEVSQIALLQLQSYPAGASIYLNGDLQGFTTPGRHEMGVGPAEVKMSLKGYRDWTKKINLKATEVRWLNYVRLVPKEIKTTNILNLGTANNTLLSPNKRWMMIIPEPSSRTHKLVDFGDPANIKTTDFIMPATIRGETFSLFEWDSKSEYVLLSNNLGDIIRVDRRDPNSINNLSFELKTEISSAHFSSDVNIIYGIVEGSLRRINVSDLNVSSPLIKSVSSFSYYEDKIIYVANPSESKQEVGVFYNNKTTVVKTFNDNEAIKARFSHYYYRDYVTISHNEDILIIQNPFAEKPKVIKELKFAGGISHLEVSNNGRFVLAWHEGQVQVYDIETEETFKFNTGSPDARPKWLDDFHLTVTIDGKLTMMNFDGSNKYELINARNLPMLSINQQYLFTIIDTPEGVTLQRSDMVVAN